MFSIDKVIKDCAAYIKTNRWQLALLVLVTLVVFSPCRNHQFTNFDDPPYITENPHIRALTLENIKNIFTKPVILTFSLASSFENPSTSPVEKPKSATSYVPLTILSFAIERYFFGPSAQVTHINNMLLHVVNVLLVFVFIHRLTRDPLCAVITALLFSIHPLRVESVAWASERKDVLHAAFYLSGLIAYLKFRHNSRNLNFPWLSLLLFILACLAKPQSVTFPFILILLDYLIDQKIILNRLWNKMPFFAIACLFLASAFVGSNVTVGSHNFLLFFDKLLLALYSVTIYLAKIIFPLNLCPLYPAPQKIHGVFPWIIYFNALIAVIFLGWAVYLMRRHHHWAWGFFFFIIISSLPLALIISNGVPLTDHYTYLPSIGIAFVLTKFAVHLYHRNKNNKVRQLLMAVGLIYVLFLSIFTFRQCDVWKDSLNLWNAVINQNSQSSIAYNNRGNTYNRLELLDEALADYNQAILLNNNDALAYNNRGIIYYKKGLCARAIDDFNAALELNPHNTEAYNNRAVCYAQLGDYTNALADINHVIMLDPRKTSAYHNRELIKKAMTPK